MESALSMKIALKNTIIFCFVLFITAVIFEFIVCCYYSYRFKTFVTPSSLSKVILGNNWGMQSSTKCSYAETLGPHPYLGYSVYSKAKEECNVEGLYINNRGMSGPDYPEEKDSSSFTVLLTGGSVADILGSRLTQKGTHFLTDYFNEKFVAPNGRKFRFIVSALGDYRFPQNVISVLINNDLIDGVIDLSGFNESYQHQWNNRFENPSENYWAQFELETNYLINQTRNKAFHLANWMSTSLCRFSYSCIFVVEKRIGLLISQKKVSGRHTPQKQYDEYLNGLPKDLEKSRFNKHRNYYRMLNAVCHEMDYKCAFFLQPVPQLFKKLSADEKIIVANTDPHFGKLYQKIIDELLVLQKENVPIHSLAKVFSDESQTIYKDHIHYAHKQGEYIEPGYTLLLKELTRSLVKDWKLKEK